METKQQQNTWNISLPKLTLEQLTQVTGGPIEVREVVIKVNVKKLN